MLDDLAGKLLLPIAIVTGALLLPGPAPVVVEVGDWPVIPAPTVVVETPAIVFPEAEASVVNVAPSVPVVVEKRVDVAGPTVTVFEDREVVVEVPVEVRTCLNFDELPYFDLARAVSVARPGESWSLSGDHYSGLSWLDSTPMPSMSEIIGGWLWSLEDDC